MTGRSLVRTMVLHLNFPRLGLGNLAAAQPSCFIRVKWQLSTGRRLNFPTCENLQNSSAMMELPSQNENGSPGRKPRLGNPGNIPALVLPSDDMTARHRKGVTAERFFIGHLVEGLGFFLCWWFL
ncbi:hypothetical protein T265_03858 [Opisthorchis viverrini]|uniref:Uncharacterized protein n=1 Tax=Opisthorchis viverrini TaxID=6198 RepID=A0A074ZUN6_OPIVI|nr:hypothetical protein T265_03858 [Opisthorchis viverrini]KER29562.1 hypothetical protein T265_03858 [Opisthorchis viverrini]